MAAALTPAEIAVELAACKVALPPAALDQLSTYLELLLRWNRRINLTGVREPQAIVRRLFGESLFLAKQVELSGWLVDVGSGAGFPGLALKLAAPELRVTLIEPRQRKAAFLKEVIRQCGINTTDVVVKRFETWSLQRGLGQADIVTTRGVTVTPQLLSSIARRLAPSGTAVFFTSDQIAQALQVRPGPLGWQDPIGLPSANAGVLLIGRVRQKQ